MRTTGVRLIADVDDFRRGFREGAKEVRNLGEEVGRIRGLWKQTGTEARNAAKANSDNVAEMARNVMAMDRQIKTVRDNLGRLASAYASGQTGVAGAIREQQKQLRELTNIRKLMPPHEDAVEAGTGLARGLRIGFIRGTVPQFASAILGSVIPIAPTLGGVVAGAVVGAAGFGGIIGGLVLAARSPGVKTAAEQLGTFILSDLTNRSRGFVDVALQALTRLRTGYQAMGNDLDRIFSSSRFVGPMTDSLIRMIRQLVRGIADAVAAADPVMTAFGDMFTTFAQDADEGASALNDLTNAAVNFIRTSTGIVHALANIKGELDKTDVDIDRFRYFIEDTLGGSKRLFDITADGFRTGSKEAEAYRRVTLGTATAADIALLKEVELGEATAAAAVQFRYFSGEVMTAEERLREVGSASKVGTEMMDGLLHSTGMVTAKMLAQKQAADLLKSAHEQMYGGVIRLDGALTGYEASWDSLKESVDKNGHSLSRYDEKGRSNRKVLAELLTANGELFYANIQAGDSLEVATRKHDVRTEAVRKEAGRLKLGKTATEELINTYGRIPRSKGTNLFIQGFTAIEKALLELYAYQRSLLSQTPIHVVRQQLRSELHGGFAGDPKAFHNAQGGPIHGPGTSTSDSIPAWLSDGEYVVRAKSVDKIGEKNLEYLNKYGELPAPGYAGGGLIALRGKNFGQTMKYTTNVYNAWRPTRKWISDRAIPNFGPWPSSPSAQRGDSGVWRGILRMIKMSGINEGSFGNAYRHGDPKWHGSGRAVDWMGYNLDRLASYFAARRPLELIHRTNRRDYAYTRGRNMGSFNNGLMEAHRNHLHIAMNRGGMIKEPVVGIGASGKTYTFGESGPERVLSTAQTQAGAAVTNNITVTVNAPVGSHPREIGREIGMYLQSYMEGGGRLVVHGQPVIP